MFNLKNKECQRLFMTETTNTNVLSKPFEDEPNLEVATDKFFKRLNKMLHKCFKKIGVKNEKINETFERMYNKWKSVRNKTDPESVEETRELEALLADDYFEKINEATKETSCTEGDNNNQKLWEMKKKRFFHNKEIHQQR